MTIGEWLDIWLKEYLADVKQGTKIHYESVARLYLKPAFGKVSLSKLRAPMVQKFYLKLTISLCKLLTFFWPLHEAGRILIL